MILQSLHKYYEKLAEQGKVPPFGFSKEKVGYGFILNREGRLMQVESYKDEKVDYKWMVIPYSNEVNVRAVNVQPNFLVDKPAYVLGIDRTTIPTRLEKTKKAYRSLFRNVISAPKEDEALNALNNFLEEWDQDSEHAISLLSEMSKATLRECIDVGTRFIAFRIDGQHQYIHESAVAKSGWSEYVSKRDYSIEACMVTGEMMSIQRLHAQFKGIQGGQSSGASLVSFNFDATESYAKKSGSIAPVGVLTEFKYSTALKYLLSGDSRQRVQIGSTTTLFWSDGTPKILEFLVDILGTDGLKEENYSLRQFLDAVSKGQMPKGEDLSGKFYILGLVPNMARLAVQLWYVSTVAEFYQRINQHFNDLKIGKKYSTDPDFPSMWYLLRQLAPPKGGGKRDYERISPPLVSAFLRAILSGSIYPSFILTMALSRIRAEQGLKDDKGRLIDSVNYARVSLVKAYLIRYYRIHKINKEVSMALSKDETAISYRLGRLFAVLEKIQGDSLGKEINASIKDKFFGSASSMPASVFPYLVKLAQKHLRAIDRTGIKGNNDKLVQEILTHVTVFPKYLNLEDQGLFVIGYYHQKQDFFNHGNQKEAGNE